MEHVCTDHPLMSDKEFQETYRHAWDAFCTPEHVETVMRRAVACGMSARRILKLALWFYGCQTIEGVHPLQGGLFRRKYRRDRRPGLPVENPVRFYGRYLWEIVLKHARLGALAWRCARACRRVERDSGKQRYVDLALTPAADEDLEELDIFKSSESARSAAQKVRRRRAKCGVQFAAE
jgi:hypothetical protein